MRSPVLNRLCRFSQPYDSDKQGIEHADDMDNDIVDDDDNGDGEGTKEDSLLGKRPAKPHASRKLLSKKPRVNNSNRGDVSWETLTKKLRQKLSSMSSDEW